MEVKNNMSFIGSMKLWRYLKETKDIITNYNPSMVKQ